jgi:hypothetical protein
MKKYILPLVSAIAIIITACNSNQAVISQYLNTSNLAMQEFTITTSRDTTVKTNDGIILSIPANTIKAGGSAVTLQVKEALSMAQIIKAGLTTLSGKDVLSSDGMFYIATKEQSTITGAIHIKLPTPDANKKMQLYKGVEKDGKIDWQQPTPVTKTITPLADSGQLLFTTNCAACHAVDKQLTGPALAWMDKHKSKEWLYAFIKDNTKVLAGGDAYAQCTYCYFGSAMTIFNTLTNRDIDAICRYVDKEARVQGIPESFNPFGFCDSCGYYKAYYHDLEWKRDSLMKNNGQMAKLTVIPPALASASTGNSNSSINDIDKVSIEKHDAEYYQFTVTAYGWYNVDVLLNTAYNSKESELRVRIQGAFKYRVAVMLAIPSAKVFAEGGVLKNSEDFGFYTTDGKIPLPQGIDAYIIALSEEHEKIYYAIQQFTTSTSQTINISLKESSRDTVLKTFETLKLASVKMEIEKTKNFEGMKAVDTELEKLKAKLTHCACVERDTTLIIKNK